ncbi:hypothetical protein OSB04_007088 [Centaurea solstitialis]|uniref:ATP-dependent DNA helicase n=1 Tax=Centaurea solstitialis TaxID=347529 RepID=A0AA38TJ70_9ASTR|nr:hypothetical protein OSB04_007088 [Centaurea solstitialis]
MMAFTVNKEQKNYIGENKHRTDIVIIDFWHYILKKYSSSNFVISGSEVRSGWSWICWHEVTEAVAFLREATDEAEHDLDCPSYLGLTKGLSTIECNLEQTRKHNDLDMFNCRETQNGSTCATMFDANIQNNGFGWTRIPFGSLPTRSNKFTCCDKQTFVNPHGKIVLSIASSGIASLLLPGGPIDEYPCCSIDVGSDLAELINILELIIWDEAPLQHRYAFEAVDRTLRDVCRRNVPVAEQQVFGGKVVVLGGDFRQILLVIPSAPRSEIVASVINKSSTIWDACKVFILTTNMRLHDPAIEGDDLIQMEQFNNWILDMGAGRLPAIALEGEDEATWITIPDDLLIPIVDDLIEAVVSNIFPDISNRLHDISCLKERCILCLTNDDVDMINSHVLTKMLGEMHELLSADEICASTDNLEEMQIMYSCEFLNTLRFSGIPNHKLELKVGAPIILLRNINLQKGLCNGTRLVVTQISRRVIEAVIITSTHVAEKSFIERIDMTPTDTSWPFTFKRRQFPIKVCFAMTINKSQGQTFNHVCAYLVKPVFTHGQLYVTASRVTSRTGLRFYVDNGGKCDNNISSNVVYKVTIRKNGLQLSFCPRPMTEHN